MGKAKKIIIKAIDSKTSNNFVKRHHYSGKVVNNSQLHLGVFLEDDLHGVMQFGPSLDKRKVMGLVKGTGWNNFIELNRMAFDDSLPKNSESRALSIAFRLIKQYRPQIKWIVSFADACQSGSGTIYRASGFLLTKITVNKTIWVAPNGEVATDLSLRLGILNAKKVVVPSLTSHKAHKMGGGASMKTFKDAGYKPLEGYQLRYIKFLDPGKEKDLQCEVIPYAELDKLKFPEGVKHKEHLKRG